jgi:N-acetylglucosaminyldiphosphoundecaprenol N-acetyl-beta-D-mannosaminyltransferase
MNKLSLFDVRVDEITLNEVINKVKQFIKKKSPHYLISLGSLTILLARKDKELREIIKRADLVLCDSVGVQWGLKFLYDIKIEKISGVDLIPILCDVAVQNKYRLFFLGSTKEVIKKAVENVKRRYKGINICGFSDGYFDIKKEDLIKKWIKKSKPDILLVGLGQPFQEKWIFKNLNYLKVPLCIGIGGSFDVLGGKVKRAPLFFQRIGFEWFFRLVQEPWRIKRVVKLLCFIGLIIKTKMLILKNFLYRR